MGFSPPPLHVAVGSVPKAAHPPSRRYRGRRRAARGPGRCPEVGLGVGQVVPGSLVPWRTQGPPGRPVPQTGVLSRARGAARCPRCPGNSPRSTRGPLESLGRPPLASFEILWGGKVQHPPWGRCVERGGRRRCTVSGLASGASAPELAEAMAGPPLPSERGKGSRNSVAPQPSGVWEGEWPSAGQAGAGAAP